MEEPGSCPIVGVFFLVILLFAPAQVLGSGTGGGCEMAGQSGYGAVSVHPDARALSEELAVYVTRLSREAIADHGSFTVAFSGGSLPNLVAGSLGDPAVAAEVEWDKWVVFFADERFVPLDDEQSNYQLCNKVLFAKVGVAAGNIHPAPVDLPLADCATKYEATIRSLVPEQRFDLILLGMGPDGHTASLFPGHALLGEKKALVSHIFDSPKEPPQRITFTLPLICRAKHVAFVVTGASKAEVLGHVHSAGSSVDYPVRHVRPSDFGESGEVAWFLDAPAAAKL